MIDRKALNAIADVYEHTIGSEHATMIRQAVNELADHAPLTREELETVLKEAGFPVVASDNDEDGGRPYCWNNLKFIILLHTGEIIIRDLSKNALVLSIPLSAVTRAMLRIFGVIK